MKEAECTLFTTHIWGNGKTRLNFIPGKRFFLDEVLVRKTPIDNGIAEVVDKRLIPKAYYSLDGRLLAAPQHGLIIVKYADGTIRKVYN